MTTIPFHSPRGCLSYLVFDPLSREALLIDPSEEIATELYLSTLTEQNLTLRYLVETHTHADHISSAMKIKELSGAKIVRHKNAPSPHNDIPVMGGEILPLGKREIRVIATPGHTNESISLHVENTVFTGDALLIGGTGRTDFQLGDSEALYRSLHETLGTLPDETVLYPAHDYKDRTSSTIGMEKRTNPRFLLTHEAFIEMMDAYHPPAPDLFEVAIPANTR